MILCFLSEEQFVFLVKRRLTQGHHIGWPTEDKVSLSVRTSAGER